MEAPRRDQEQPWEQHHQGMAGLGQIKGPVVNPSEVLDIVIPEDIKKENLP